MNSCTFLGYLTSDLEVKQGTSGVNYTNFTVAINRLPEKDGTRKADFIPCVAFGNNAINISKYFRKGSKILVQGEWRTDSFERDGVKYYTHKLLVYRFYFVERANQQSSQVSYQQAANEQIKQDFEVPTINEVPNDDFGFSVEDDFGF